MLLQMLMLLFCLTYAGAARPFDIILLNTNCTVLNTDYATSFECPLVHLSGNRGNYMNAKLVIKRDINKLVLHFRFMMHRPLSAETYDLFNFETDGCHLNQLSTKNSILKAVLKKLVQNGNFKRCPMRSNVTFEAERFSLNPDHLPPYTPDMNFTVELKFIVEKAIPMVAIRVDVAIVRKKKKS